MIISASGVSGYFQLLPICINNLTTQLAGVEIFSVNVDVYQLLISNDKQAMY